MKHAMYKDKFIIQDNADGESRLKTLEEFCRDQNKKFVESKTWIHISDLNGLATLFPNKKGTPEEIKKQNQLRLCFVNFLKGLLKIDPIERWTAREASMHPFITGD